MTRASKRKASEPVATSKSNGASRASRESRARSRDGA